MAEARDFTNIQFSKLLQRLEEHPSISDAYEQHHPQKQGAWYSSQREHMVSWFRSQSTLGSGKYTRSTPNRSAKTTYNRLLSPGGLIWISDALGADPALVKHAAEAAIAEPEYRKRCAVIRAVLPWALIAELAEEQELAETWRAQERRRHI